MKLANIFGSLAFKLYSLVVLSILFVSIAISQYTISSRTSNMLMNESKRANDIATRVTGFILNQVLEKDFDLIEKSLSGMMYDDGIARVALLDENNISIIKLFRQNAKIVVSYEKTKFETLQNSDKKTFNISSINTDEQHKYGIFVELNSKNIKEFDFEAKRDVAIVAFTSSVFSIFVVMLMLRGILRDTDELSNFASTLASFDGRLAPEAKSSVEFNRLSKALSYASTQIQIQSNKIKSSQQELIDKERLLIQQSKMATMGEMIGAIGHQWRQPLNSLALMVQDVKLAHSLGQLNDEYISKFKDNSMQTIHTMSNTIEDFRRFFSPNKKTEEFFIEDAINESLRILESQLKTHNVDVTLNDNMTKYHPYIGYKNELKQVLLNILANAKDAIFEREPDRSFIKIDVHSSSDDTLEISIEDSAGGISEDIIDKVFDSYFTTKQEGSGTGIGLYMSKQIVENSLQGRLSVGNTANGARFVIELVRRFQ